MRRYSFDGGPEVNQDSGEWVKYADVQAWMEKNAQAYQREGKYERAAAVFALLHVLADLAQDRDK